MDKLTASSFPARPKFVCPTNICLPNATLHNIGECYHHHHHRIVNVCCGLASIKLVACVFEAHCYSHLPRILAARFRPKTTKLFTSLRAREPPQNFGSFCVTLSLVLALACTTKTTRPTKRARGKVEKRSRPSSPNARSNY